MPPPGLDNLKHLVVLMMENRSFDHMLGSLRATNPGIDGIPDDYTNPDINGTEIRPQAKAKYQSQLNPDPNHDFAPVNEQIFNGGAVPSMQGFIRSYYNQRNDVNHSHAIMYYFKPNQLPVLTTLATEFALFNRWFASIPGPTLCNRAFAHYGTSFGNVAMEKKYSGHDIKSIYQRVLAVPNTTTKLYYFDRASSTLELINLLEDQPQIFATYEQFLADCYAGTLPDYSFVEPNYLDHDGLIASDQHPDHHVAEGERFIASIYMAIRSNPTLWPNTALLITYDEHGGIFDHVPPPACIPDGFTAPASATGTGQPFNFDRLGVRVPAILVSPWVPAGTIVNEVFEHASIPATVTEWLLPGFAGQRTPREAAARTFLNVLDAPAIRDDAPEFA